MANVAFVSSNLPKWRAVVAAKRSDQHSLGAFVLTLGAHLVMLPWALFYAQEPGLAIGYALSIVTTGAIFATVLYFRRWPGGRP